MAIDYPSRIDICTWGNWEGNVNTVTRKYDNSYLDLASMYTANTINSSVSWKVLLKSGTWSLSVMYYRTTDRAISTVTLGGTTLGTIDMSGTNRPNNVDTTLSGVIVSSRGLYTLSFTAASKNGGSTGYYQEFQHITLIRTGA